MFNRRKPMNEEQDYHGGMRLVLDRLPRDLDEPSHANRARPYAPQLPPDPMRLASLTVESVSKLGLHSATEIRKVAESIRKGAQEVADKLNELADAIEHHSDIAHSQVATFANKATNALEGARVLLQAFEAETPPPPKPAPSAVQTQQEEPGDE